MNIRISNQFKDDILLLRKENVKLPYKIWELIFDIKETPFTGLGKPEALKENMSGFWSRRIDQKHRLIYRIKDNVLELISCYGHYE
jgi:toxin YoeB